MTHKLTAKQYDLIIDYVKGKTGRKLAFEMVELLKKHGSITADMLNAPTTTQTVARSLLSVLAAEIGYSLIEVKPYHGAFRHWHIEPMTKDNAPKWVFGKCAPGNVELANKIRAKFGCGPVPAEMVRTYKRSGGAK